MILIFSIFSLFFLLYEYKKMEFERPLGRSIYDPPPFKTEYFAYWRLAMENFILMGNFESWVALKEGFDSLSRRQVV